jgi:hypothetical protein
MRGGGTRKYCEGDAWCVHVGVQLLCRSCGTFIVLKQVEARTFVSQGV